MSKNETTQCCQQVLLIKIYFLKRIINVISECPFSSSTMLSAIKSQRRTRLGSRNENMTAELEFCCQLNTQSSFLSKFWPLCLCKIWRAGSQRLIYSFNRGGRRTLVFMAILTKMKKITKVNNMSSFIKYYCKYC